MEHLDSWFVRFAKLAHDGDGIRNSSLYNFCHCLARALTKRGSKVSDELVPVKHAHFPVAVSLIAKSAELFANQQVGSQYYYPPSR